MNIFKLPNVGRSMTERHDDDYKRQVSRYIRDKQRDDGVTVTEADLGPMVADTPLLGELVSKLVVDKPNWQFEVFHFYPSAHNNCIAYRCVNIKNQSGEVLGIVEAGTRYGRTGSVQTVEVYNNRISKERERSRGSLLRMSKPPYVQSINSSTTRPQMNLYVRHYPKQATLLATRVILLE